ncbi:MAG: Rid family detoxifying hydrolase [Candidatus Omnitrophota bacterium]|nr:Rid family detoxifying hydrolase [Candidatus Omnitrophota bacterium]MDZ4242599.1 Rid family detoxifying hydrolase [Candidatus Omnitrophota bacterium]
MSKKIVKPAGAPQPVGPYNQAVIAGQLVYTAGQIPLDLKTGALIQAGVPEQTRLVLTHLKAVLEGAGSSLEKVIKTTVFLKNMTDFPAMNAVYAEFFKTETAPARSTVEVARLPKDALVEIEAVALL